MFQQGYSGQEYRQQEILGASPLRLVVMAYDLAIHSCEQGDVMRAIQAVSALRDALNFDYPEASVGLFRLYQWVLDCLRAGDFNNALNVLSELRDAWVTVEKQLNASGQPPQPPQQTSTTTTRNTLARA